MHSSSVVQDDSFGFRDQEQKTKLLNKLQLVREDPWDFLGAVRTQDQVDRKNPIKPFPRHLDYLKVYVRLWQKEPLIAVPKSRRMLMTWTNVCLYLWDTMWQKSRAQAFVSKKEEDADELVRRAVFVLENLDHSLIPKDLVPKWSYKYGVLTFPELNSYIKGFPQGADQLRQFTFSGILADEAGFWPDAQKMYAASRPTLDGGGRMTMVSSPAPGFFRKLVHDELDMG